MSKVMLYVRLAIVAILMAFGLVAAAPAVAQEDAATEVVDEAEGAADEAASQAEDVTEDDDDGFDWGLLGLLGLLGLAGLFRRPQPVVHDVDRPTTRTSGGVDDTRV